MIFRPEQLHEVEAIHAVERAAFGREAEAGLVDQIRASGGITLSLVAVDDEEIVGHVLFSPVTIRSEVGEFRALGMGPVAVRPDRQKQGGGSGLIRTSLDIWLSGICRDTPSYLAAACRTNCQFVLHLGRHHGDSQ